MRISVENERKLVNEILINIGVQEDHAKIITEATLDSDLKGFTSHGLGRFPQYIRGINNGFIETKGDYEIVKDEDSIALIEMRIPLHSLMEKAYSDNTLHMKQ